MNTCKICGKSACAGCAEYYDDQIDALGKEVAAKTMLIAELVSGLVKAEAYLTYNCAEADMDENGIYRPNIAMQIASELKELIKEAE